MPGPHGVITVNGKAEPSLGTNKYTTALTAEATSSTLMDGGSCLNLLYQDTVRKVGIDHLAIKPTKATFRGIIPGVEASCTGSIALEVVFRSPENYRTEELIFEIVPFRSDYQALLG